MEASTARARYSLLSASCSGVTEEPPRRNRLNLGKRLTSKDNPRVDSRSAQLGKSLSYDLEGKVDECGSTVKSGDDTFEQRAIEIFRHSRDFPSGEVPRIAFE